MKSLVLFFLISFIIFNSFSQKNTSIQFDITSYDFGEIREVDGPVVATFTFTNMGKEPFVISNVINSCGCTTADYTKEPVKKGKTGYLKAIYDPKNENGNFIKLITVEGNSVKKYQLRIVGKVIPRPKSIYDDYKFMAGNLRFIRQQIILGEIKKGAVDTATVKIYNASNSYITVKSIVGPYHILPAFFPRKLEPNQINEIQFFYSSYLKNQIGHVYDEIKLITDDPAMPEKKLVVMANIVEDFENMTEEEYANTARLKINKTEHDFGTLNEGDAPTYYFTIKNEGKSQLYIYDIDAECGCTATTLGSRNIDAGQSTKLMVVYHSENREGPQHKVIKITSNDPESKEIHIDITANVIPRSKKQ